MTKIKARAASKTCTPHEEGGQAHLSLLAQLGNKLRL